MGEKEKIEDVGGYHPFPRLLGSFVVRTCVKMRGRKNGRIP
jgi:hypothetical protein